jgi:putative colanic acid biosynthesis acetyltransferase WcaF
MFDEIDYNLIKICVMNDFDLSIYKEDKPFFIKRIIWTVINRTIFRCIIGGKLSFVRNGILKVFGAKFKGSALIYPSVTIFAPWNLEVGQHSCVGPRVELYSKDKIIIGRNTVISQGSYICTASHDISKLLLPLVTKPITIESGAWVAADVFIGPGVTVGEGAIVGARAAVFKDVKPWTVVGGNPANFIKMREIKE